MRLTKSMRLIKVLKRGRRGVRKERAEGRKAYTTVAKKHQREFSTILFPSLPLAFFLGSCNRSLVVQVACWAYAPNKER